MILPIAFRLGGVARGAALAASALIVSDLCLRLVRGLAALQPPERRGPVRRALVPRVLEAAGRIAFAALAAGGVWVGLIGRWPAAAVLALAAAVWLLME